MTYWRVVAHRVENHIGGFTVKQIPTFYISAEDHGITTGNTTHAENVALGILQSSSGGHAEFSVSVAEL